MNYSTLGTHKTQFELRPIRNVIIKQNSPKDDDSSIYEIFNRLNTGGINLRPQEIRASLHHSDFYDMLFEINIVPDWRRILPMPDPDLHSKDIEILLRGFAMLIDSGDYKPSLTKFLNKFSKKCKTHSDAQNIYLRELFTSFLKATEAIPEGAFLDRRTRRFNIALFEAVFAITCENAFKKHTLIEKPLDNDKIQELKVDGEFSKASLEGTTRTANVQKRLERAHVIFEKQ